LVAVALHNARYVTSLVTARRPTVYYARAIRPGSHFAILRIGWQGVAEQRLGVGLLASCQTMTLSSDIISYVKSNSWKKQLSCPLARNSSVPPALGIRATL